jgi:hypothetical protein
VNRARAGGINKGRLLTAEQIVRADAFRSRCRRVGACVEYDGCNVFKVGPAGYCLTGRVGYALHHGSAPAGVAIERTCKNSRCVRPLHLRAVTPGEGIVRWTAHVRRGLLSEEQVAEIRRLWAAGQKDAALLLASDHRGAIENAGRNSTFFDPDYTPVSYGKCELHPWAKLTRVAVNRARRRAREGETINTLARDYGVATSTMWEAVRGVTWGCCSDEPAVPSGR